MKNLFLFFLLTCFFCNHSAAQNFHHDINVSIDIPEKSLSATDKILIKSTFFKSGKDSLIFYLNSDFAVESITKRCRLTELKNPQNDSTSEIKVKKYQIIFPKGNKKDLIVTLKFNGKIKGEIKNSASDVARGFSETAGIISQEGIYLCGSTYWIPYFDDEAFTFNLETEIDSNWTVVSQGTRTNVNLNKDRKITRYESPFPSDEVYLVAAKWKEYNKQSGTVLVQAVLRTPDDELAKKYLDATVGYLEMYEKLIGPYPYTKFTLVENFWETGYGMPSFTLLGEKIIRFPFILTSSYPHELLHNYWGNSVYVDYKTGNWCEGLTAYMADHLIKEQQGLGAEYRRVSLQKFTDFVNESNDFPVSKFLSRSSAAEEAIGYGKVAMIYEMLRYKFGDDIFRKSISKFYTDNKFKKASFDDIRKAFEEKSGTDLKPFFAQWTQRTGAPTFKLDNVNVTEEEQNYKLNFDILQIQKEDEFTLDVPVVIYFEDSVIVKNILVNDRKNVFSFSFTKRPVRLDVDPQFNVFRRLDKSEVPIALSQIFGDKDAVMILPKNSPNAEEYKKLAEQWKQTQEVQGNKLEILYDDAITELPAKASWVVGYENKFASGLNTFSNYASHLSKETLDIYETLKTSGGLVYVFPNSKNKMATNLFIGTVNKKQVEALSRKISHYSKYSYLGFEGDAGVNKLKGEFPALSSPLIFYINTGGKIITSKAKLPLRKALI